jgi:feruloyl esterase
VPHGSVTLAQTVAPGTFTPPSGRAGAPGGQNPFARLGSFCRVAVTLKPGPQSDIKAEVWLPSSGWNGKLQVVGNGGFAGTISYPAMATALAAGYAAASTDTGHTGPSPNTFANDDVLIDFAHRAIHETTVTAKATVKELFGDAPKLAYFNGCSTGGRQAVTAAQRYPDDFDGIVGGAPASHTSTQAFGQIWFSQALADPASALPREKLTMLHEAVLNACDELDGAKDGVLENPLSCKFDPQVLACKQGGDSASCLTPAQVDGVRRIYAGPSNPRTGHHIFAGLERGSELGWNPVPVGYAVDYFKYIVFKDSNWDPKALNFDSHVKQAATGDNLIFDANKSDMSAFTKRGGKLILYQGWGEPGIPPANLVRYYGQIQSKTSGAKDAVRLFMVPGMGHCGGGTGVNTFDMVTPLDQWVTAGNAPAQIPASRMRNGVSDRTRPLCAYPQIAIYKGTGSIEDTANFSCGIKSPTSTAP